MAKYDLIIRNGTIVTASDSCRADLGIRQGRVVAIGDELHDSDDEFDASGKLVLPGGIDSHVHIAQPSGPGIVMADDFESATLAAAFGGNSTVMPYCLQQKGQSLRAALTDYHALAKDQCYVDHSFHLIVADPTESVLGQELPALFEDGYTSFKVFMTYEGLALNDYEMLSVFEVARKYGALVQVHAENYDALRFLTERLEQSGHTAPHFHGRSRPIPVESEATHRAIALAELIDVPIMIVHVSNREAMEEIRRARARGLNIMGETCPQYLMLTEADMGRDGMEGAKYVCSPPPRDHASQDACWEGLQQGIFSVFSSDHCPFRFADEAGKQAPKGRSSFRWIPNGIPGIETRLPILFSEGVVRGRITLQQFVALTATNHAKIYGLTNKGSITVGNDADIAIWDPTLTKPIKQANLHHGADYTPYEDLAITGWPTSLLVRGRFVVRDGDLVSGKGTGQHLSRAKPAIAAM
jgi:dihydropyrimidinase